LTSQVCAATGGYDVDQAYGAPLLAWRDAATNGFRDAAAPAWFEAVSCAGDLCTYVGRSWEVPDGSVDFPVVYQGAGLHPVQQSIPLPGA
jgi:hypothetical protein